MKFLIVEPYPLPILIPLGPKYSPQDPVFKFLHFGYMTCPFQSTIISGYTLGERYKLLSSSFRSLLHSPFASLLGSNIRLRILFSNSFSLCSSLNVRYHASQPYSTTGNITVLYILILKFLEVGKTKVL